MFEHVLKPKDMCVACILCVYTFADPIWYSRRKKKERNAFLFFKCAPRKKIINFFRTHMSIIYLIFYCAGRNYTEKGSPKYAFPDGGDNTVDNVGIEDVVWVFFVPITQDLKII